MLRLPPGLSVPLFNVKVIADGEKLKIDVGMLTAQLASYEPELDISQGYTPEPGEHPADTGAVHAFDPLVRFSRSGPANFQQAQPDVIPALHTGQELRVIYHAHKSLKFCLLLVNGAPRVVELPLV